jgi:hypothetical protein
MGTLKHWRSCWRIRRTLIRCTRYSRFKFSVSYNSTTTSCRIRIFLFHVISDFSTSKHDYSFTLVYVSFACRTVSPQRLQLLNMGTLKIWRSCWRIKRMLFQRARNSSLNYSVSYKSLTTSCKIWIFLFYTINNFSI